MTHQSEKSALVLNSLTRKTKELDHEKLVTVIDKKNTKELDHKKLVTVFLGPLSDRHWLYLYMEIVALRTRRTKATDTDLYNFISDGEHVFDCSEEQSDHSVEQRLSLAYRGDLL
jgi:hypothetical protein